jgi:hypothetical protein
MELFDIIKTIFKSDKDWKNVGRNDKVKNFFMINRIMSIQFPVQANQFNHIKVSQKPVIDWWHNTLSTYYSKQPPWIFTSTKKKPKISDPKIPEAFENAEQLIIEKYEISKREIIDLKKFYPEEYQVWVKSINDQIGPISKNNDI